MKKTKRQREWRFNVAGGQKEGPGGTFIVADYKAMREYLSLWSFTRGAVHYSSSAAKQRESMA